MGIPASGTAAGDRNVIQLHAMRDGAIESVHVYRECALVARVYTFSVHGGMNEIVLNDFPNDGVDRQTLRVGFTGSEKPKPTVHDVTFVDVPPLPCPTKRKSWIYTVDQLPELQAFIMFNATYEHFKDRAETWATADINQHGITKETFAHVQKNLEQRMAKLDQEILQKHNKEETAKEQASGDNKAQVQVVIGAFADEAYEVELRLSYVINRAGWDPAYEIRVNTNSSEKPIYFTYRAKITQDTGEDWCAVPLTVEAGKPDFGVGLPTLNEWVIEPGKQGEGIEQAAVDIYDVPTSSPSAETWLRWSWTSLFSRKLKGSLDHAATQPREPTSYVNAGDGEIRSTFPVPRQVTVPSGGGAKHGVNVILYEGTLEATLSWIVVPKKDTKVYLKAAIRNNLPYKLDSGPCGVSIDGVFVQRTDWPSLAPRRTLDYLLGTDPTIRVMYGPSKLRTTRSRLFMARTLNHVYTQHIAITNTRPARGGLNGTNHGGGAIAVQVIDQFPISKSPQIVMKRLSPALGAQKRHLRTSIGATRPSAVAHAVGAEADGIFLWQCFVAPRATRVIAVSWSCRSVLGSRLSVK